MPVFYEHKQKGGWVFVGSVAATLGLVAVMVLCLRGFHLFTEQRPLIPSLVLIGITAAIGLAYLWLAMFTSSLTVRINSERIALQFGPWGWRRQIRLADVVLCRPVRNPWHYGWGLRRINKGWLFNVAGFDAVELTLRSGKRIRIGTDEPERLIHAIQEATQHMT